MNKPSSPKKCLWDKIQEDENCWGLRVALDMYALLLDIPLRIYSLVEAKKYWEYAREVNVEFREGFVTQARFDEYVRGLMAKPTIVESIKAIVANEEKTTQKEASLSDTQKLSIPSLLTSEKGDYWYTYRSNVNPMLQSLSEHILWRRWEFYWLYHQFVLKEESPTEDIKTINWGFDEHLHLSYLWIRELNSFLIAGPVWMPTGKDSGEFFENDRVKPFVETFVKLIQEVAGKAEGREHLSPHQDRLIRLGNSRFPMGRRNLTSRLQQAAFALRSLLFMTIPENTTSQLQRSDYIKLAEWSLFCIKVEGMMRGYYSHIAGHRCPRQLKFYYYIKHVRSEPKTFWVRTCLNCEGGNNLPVFDLLLNEPSDIHYPDDKDNDSSIAFIEETESVYQSPPLGEIDTSLSRFLTDSLAKQNANKFEYLSTLREWLNDRFGMLTAVVEDKPLQEPLKLENLLSARIVRFLHSDIATVYRYDYNEAKLITLGLYHSGTQRKLWREQEPRRMEQAAKKPDWRKRSICYRCVDDTAIKFCRAFNPETEKAEPPEEELLPPEGFPSHQSGIAVPIAVNSRPWGVLEVLGNRPYQFRWDDRRFMGELSEILGPFFYYQWFLAKLHEMNKIAVDKKATPEGYDGICRCLSEMLLSYGAGLWVRGQEQNLNSFLCKGRHNRPWEQKLSPEEEKIRPGQKSAVTKAIEERQKEKKLWQGWWEGKVGEDETLDADWKRLPRNKLLCEEGIQTLCSIPVYVPSENDEVLAVIVLYNKTGKKYDIGWKHFFDLVARYTALVLEAMQAQSEHERRSRAFISHEVKTHVDFLLDKANSLRESLLVSLNKSSRKNSMVQLGEEQVQQCTVWIKDLTVHTHYLKDTLDLLKDDSFGKYLISISPVVALANKRRLEQKADKLLLYDEFNQTFRETLARKNKRLSVKYENPYGHSLRICIHKDNLLHIMSNLYDNAVKYAKENSAIEAEVSKMPNTWKLTISNIGECLAHGEEYRIFENGFRGKNATSKSGEGKGLFIVRGICELYEIGIAYNSQPLPESRYCKHSFTLSFPTKMVEIH
ncbi:MAG: hypothetical protein BWK78_02120 [Thiotrichaceae bacterium IS1]|nr:MAG: hypothetical protein BWK78_02120 [Thiotrichaceae bacterium IS1]